MQLFYFESCVTFYTHLLTGYKSLSGRRSVALRATKKSQQLMRKITLIPLTILFVTTLLTYSCNKETTRASTNRQLLIQGKRSLISITRLQSNGPGRFQYTGAPSDYFNFTADSVYSYVEGVNDNVGYKLLSDDSTLVYYTTDIGINISDTAFISTLTNNLLVFHGQNAGGDLGIDSLKR